MKRCILKVLNSIYIYIFHVENVKIESRSLFVD
jgi:hypothetical protein